MKIIDIGRIFGMAVAEIFNPWKAVVLPVTTLKDVLNNIEDTDLVMLGGGEDINPAIYGHMNVASGSNQVSKRDIFEIEVFKMCVRNKVPMLGICRGSQMLCALNGGSLIQDVNNHGLGHGHLMYTHDGREVYMTSTHHQLMHPYAVPHTLIAWTKGRINHANYDERKLGRIDIPMEKEPEIVYFPLNNTLCVQGHPEYYDDMLAPPVAYVRELVETHLGVHP